MAKFRPPIFSLSTGEIAPDMAGRVDLDKYASSCRLCLNAVTRPHGSAYRRSGTQHVHPAKHADKACVLLDFDFNGTVSQSYVLEVGNLYMRFFMDGGVIVMDDEPYELATPWTEAQVAGLRHWQALDVVYMTHGNVSPRRLIRHDHDNWSMEALDFRIPGYDLEITDTNADGKKDGKQGDTLVLPAGREFDAKMICKGVNPAGEARWFEYHGDGYWKAPAGATKTLTFRDTPSLSSGSLEIKAVYTSAGVLNNSDWVELESDSSAPAEWTGTNWPRLVGMYEDRLILASTPEQPLNYWISRTGHYTDFRKNTATDGEPLDDDAIWRALTGSRMSNIMWMVDTEDLFMGTTSSEVRVWSGTDGEPLTPGACQGKRVGALGASDVPGQLVGNSVLYVSRSGRKVRQLAFRTTEYRFRSDEITLFSQHITGPGIRDIAYCVEPDGVLWCARTDGLICACTYLPEQNVVGWHRHVLGGDGVVESLASVPGASGDELWMVVRRQNADNSTRRDVERLAPKFEALNPDGTEKEDAREGFFLDSGLTYRGAAVSEVTGLEHLEGKTVHVLADGIVLTPRAVAGGKVSLDRPASLVHVGLPYVTDIEPMPLDIPIPNGTTKVMPKKVTAATVRLLHSVGGKVAAGSNADRLFEPILQTVPEIEPGQAQRLFSGYRRVNLSGGSERDAVVCVRQDQPFPLTLLAVYPEVVIE